MTGILTSIDSKECILRWSQLATSLVRPHRARAARDALSLRIVRSAQRPWRRCRTRAARDGRLLDVLQAHGARGVV
jgi:hypothetical protein